MEWVGSHKTLIQRGLLGQLIFQENQKMKYKNPSNESEKGFAIIHPRQHSVVEWVLNITPFQSRFVEQPTFKKMDK
jgi:hypothetical protein